MAIRELTQTHTEPGNCWQTCVACLLDVDPSELPSQLSIPSFFDAALGFQSNRAYGIVLNGYLREHHSLMYWEVPSRSMEILQLMPRAPGYHMLCGPTARSSAVHHVVVARYGEMIWDPHPSRAGLTSIRDWGLLVPWWRQTDFPEVPCLCPKCQPTP